MLVAFSKITCSSFHNGIPSHIPDELVSRMGACWLDTVRGPSVFVYLARVDNNVSSPSTRLTPLGWLGFFPPPFRSQSAISQIKIQSIFHGSVRDGYKCCNDTTA